MGALSRLRAVMGALTAPAPVQRADVGYLQNDGWVTVRGGNVAEISYTGEQARRLGWERHPVVHACCRLVAETVAAVRLQAGTLNTDGEFEADPDHPLSQLFDNPSPGMPGSRFRALTTTHLLLYGNALWHERRTGARVPDRLDLVHPERLRHAYYSDELGMVAFWSWSAEQTGMLRTAPTTDVVHIPDLAADGWLFGYPRAALALGDVVSDGEASKYVREVIQNDGSPTLVFHMADLAGKDVAEQAEEVWQQKRAKRGNRGRAAFLPGTVKVEQIGFNLSDLEFPDLRRVAREDICTAFMVDPRMVGIQSATKDGGLSGEQYVEARRRVIAHAVLPVMAMIQDHATAWLAPQYGDDVVVRFNADDLSDLTENATETSARMLAEFAGGLRTWEEARDALGLPADADPAEHVPGTMTFRTVGMALEVGEQPPPDPLALIEAEAAAKAKATGSAPPAGDQSSTDEPGEGNQRGVAPTPATRTGLTPEQRVAHWRAFDARARNDEAAYLKAALGQFATEAALVSRVLSGVTRQGPDPVLTPAEADALIAAINDLYRVGGDAHQGWVERFAPLEVATGVKAGEGTLARLGVTFDLGVDPAFRYALEARVGRLATFVTEETARQIADTILAGRAQGLGVHGIAELISDAVFGGFEMTRAERIARTETVGAVNEAEWRAARASGVARSKEWLTQGDDRVRDTHADQDGVRIGMNDVFPNGLSHPHQAGADASEVVNCRCALFYSAEPPEN